MVTDRETVQAHYSPSLKAWLGDLGDGTHDGGPKDPRIGVIRVKARTATYAVSIGTAVGRGVEIIKGAVTGQASKVNKLRELTEDELNECMSDPFLLVVLTLSSARSIQLNLNIERSNQLPLLTFIRASHKHKISTYHTI